MRTSSNNKAIHKNMNNGLGRFFLALSGICLNVVFSYFMNKLGLPLFFDSIGTITVSVVSGLLFTGILTAVVSGIICSFFYAASIYFSFLNALIAIFTVWYIKNYSLKKIEKTILFAFTLVFTSSILSSLVQFLIFGDSQASLIAQNARSFSSAVNISFLPSFCLVNFLISLLDKGFSLVFAIIVLNIIPKRVVESLREGVWKQRPLSVSELKSIKNWSRDIKGSLRIRSALTLIITSTVLVFVMGWIGINLYFGSIKNERTETAKNCVKFAAEAINPAKVDDFIKYGRRLPEYELTARILKNIQNVSSGIKFLYVVRVEAEGCYFIFDNDENEYDAYNPGQLVPFDEDFEPYIPDLLAGNEIEPVESHSIVGWMLTIYHPVYDSAGRCVCYVGADISLDYMTEYMSNFILRVMLIMAGFFILIIAYAVLSTGVYTSYPISTIAACVDNFAHSGEDQEKLDENVKTIRSLDIHTGDEVEKLYKSICRMTLNQAEQMRDIMRLSDSTLKMQDGLIITMADMVENRDSDTGAHVQKTSAYVKIIVEGLKKKGYYAQKITPKFMSDVVRSAPLHDVGKINIPDGVLNKPGKLTDEEFAIMKTHTTAGKLILENAISTVQGESYLKEARNMAAYHHERWDGKGYPEGLHGEVIPLSARIMAVADVFDALASPRVYKPAFPIEKALEILQEGSGTQFDAKCVEVFMDALPEVKMILKKYTTGL
ncbi:HD domain-containing phosphohydrolase [Treponema sp. C6A8]|uniref:HD domain-containing phosphohydrolase n=1 Tax=Treponema sp. C6A8 TaxID=1410609 RepID=UPI0012DCA166|nr:HD domain-containing phosphohydrolase [Treponema sp. C6A8]